MITEICLWHNRHNKHYDYSKETGNLFLAQLKITKRIQNNKYKLAEPELYLFDYWNIEKQRDIGFYADDEEKSIFADINLETVSKMLAIPHVPIIDSNFKMTDDVDALVAYSIDKSVLNKDTWREGVVYRAKYNSECTKYDNRVSFKAINPEFLVK